MRTLIFSLLSCIIILQSCNFSRPTADDFSGWEPEIFGPLIFGKLTLDKLSSSLNTEIKRNFDASDFNLEPGKQTIPSTRFSNIGPLNFDLNGPVQSIQVQSARIAFTAKSTLPINISPGAVVRILNSSNQLITEFKFEKGLPAFGSVSLTNIISNVFISQSLRISVQDLATPGSNGQVEIQSTSGIEVTILIQDPKFTELGIAANTEFELNQEFDFNGESLTAAIDSIQGKLNLKLSNGFPIVANIGVEFIDKNSNIVLTLLPNSREINSPTTNTNGRVNGPVITSNIEIPINQTELDALKEAKKCRIVGSLQTLNNRSIYILESKQSIDFQLVSDLSVQIK